MTGIRSRLTHLPLLLTVSAVLLVLASVTGAVVAGTVGAVGVAAGVVLVVASYTLTTLAVGWADTVNTQLVLPVGVGTYVAKFSLFGVIMVAILDADWAGTGPMAVGIIVAVVGWTTAQVWWVTHAGAPRS